MTLSHIKNSLKAIRKSPVYFLKVAVLDMIFFAIFVAIAFLFIAAIAEKIGGTMEAISSAEGSDAREKIIAANPMIAMNAAYAFKMSILFFIIAFVLFSVFSGITGYMIKRKLEKKVGFTRFITQYSFVSLLMFLSIAALMTWAGNELTSIALTGFYVFHIGTFILMLITASLLVYLISVAFAILPEKSILELIKSTAKKSYQNPAMKLGSLLISLLLFLIVIYATKLTFENYPIISLFIFILLFFPSEIFSRILMSETIKEKA